VVSGPAPGEDRVQPPSIVAYASVPPFTVLMVSENLICPANQSRSRREPPVIAPIPKSARPKIPVASSALISISPVLPFRRS
jgi:hypothetical protein